MGHTYLTTPNGEELVIMSKSEFEAMRDAIDLSEHLRVMADLSSSRQELLTEEEASQAIAAATPLAFRRRKHGHTLDTRAAMSGVSASEIADIEVGARRGEAVQFMQLARALRVRIEDLIDDA